MDELRSMVAIAALEIEGKVYRLKEGFHLIGRKTKTFQIINETVDAKHALLHISSSSDHQLIDLESKHGTLVDGRQISNFTLKNKTCKINFGKCLATYKLLTQLNCGSCDGVYVGRTGQKFETRFADHINPAKAGKLPDDTTSTFARHLLFENDPDKSTIKKGGDSGFLEGKADSPQIIPCSQNSQNKKITNNTRCRSTRQNKLPLVNSSTPNVKVSQAINISDDDIEQHSFYVPETQENVFDTIADENVKKFIDDMNTVDEHYLPETQEIFMKKQSSNSMIRMTTQDFGDSFDLSINSENLCGDMSGEVPYSSNKLPKNYDSECDFEEMAELKWSETSVVDVQSNATTPDLDFNNVLVSNNTVRSNILNDDISNTESTIKKRTQLTDLSESFEPTQIFEVHKSFNKRSSENLKSFSSIIDDQDEILIPTQPFVYIPKSKPAKKLLNNLSSDINQMNLEDLDETQIFVPITNNSKQRQHKNDNFEVIRAKRKINSNASSKKSLLPSSSGSDCQTSAKNEIVKIDNFQQKITNNVTLDDTQNHSSLEITQPFFHQNLITSKSLNDSTLKEKYLKSSQDSTGLQQMRKINASTSDEDDEPLSKMRDLLTKNVSFSSNNSDFTFKTPAKTDSSVSSKSLDNTDFLMDICTPQIDLIKYPVNEMGYRQLKNTQKKKNRIMLEETDDEEDEEINFLQNILNKNDSSYNLKISDGHSSISFNSEETPQLDFIQPVLSVKTIINIGETNKNQGAKKNQKFILEDSPTEEDDEIAQLEKVLDRKEKSTRTRSIPKSLKRSHTNSESSNKSSKLNKKVKERKDFPEKYVNLEQPQRISTVPSYLSKNYVTDVDNLTQLMDIQGKPHVRKFTNPKKTVAFTRVNESKYNNTVKAIGYEIVSDPENASIIITTNEIKRTWKLLVGLAKGIPIISVDWLDVRKENSSESYENYYVKDVRTERKFNFSLKESLMKSAQRPLFVNYEFLITPNTTPPPSEMKKIIKCAGGIVIEKASEVSNKSKFVVVTDKKDSKIWIKVKKESKNVRFVKTEGILLSVMQQKIRFDDHRFKFLF